MTLLQCEKKNPCTVLRNIIDIIKMIEARARRMYIHSQWTNCKLQ